MKSRNTQGLDFEIIWATVVDTNDPEQLSRIRVRAPNDGNSQQVPDDALPWARTTIPATQPNAGGAGGTGGMGFQKGSTVVMVRDKNNFENQYILGALHVNQTGKGDQHVGAAAAGRSTQAIGGLKDGLVAGKFEPATKMSKQILSKAPPAFPQSKGKYPDTFVNVTKSGFRTVMHDVGGQTFKAEVHPTGTFTEMQADGSYVTYTAKNRKEAVDGSYTMGSEGDLVIATNGNLQIKVKGKMLVEVEGSYQEFTVGKRRMLSGENIDVGAKGQVDIIGEKAAGIESPGTTFVTGCSTVELNKASRKSAVPGISENNPTAADMKSQIQNGTYANSL